ncbi:heat shock protein 70 family, peptide-binding domain protein [Artemisia annua]|uniref:Heat shock protein 70 family, peptide-binding domain protein n=1 Tax=Artemisia annua TaxID=35608 RepID=A0A2U1LRP2_ARTAN|nr:heat shock protein 70 family, peptide-binding domain protein [Artemisia annua]
MPKRVRETAVGIDLGTTYSCVAVWLDQHNRVEIIPNKEGNRITPSCVVWDGTQLLIGLRACLIYQDAEKSSRNSSWYRSWNNILLCCCLA